MVVTSLPLVLVMLCVLWFRINISVSASQVTLAMASSMAQNAQVQQMQCIF